MTAKENASRAGTILPPEADTSMSLPQARRSVPTDGPVRRSRSTGVHTLAAALAALAVIGGLMAGGRLQRLEWLAGDALQRWDAARQTPPQDLVFIEIDQASLEAGAATWDLSWPWPRETYVRVLDLLTRAGARVVLLDLVFTEASAYGLEEDVALAEAVKRNGRAFLAIMTKARTASGERAGLAEARPDVFLPPSVDPGALAPDAAGLSQPIERLWPAFAGVGAVNFDADADGVERRVPPLTRIAGHGLLPQLGLAPLVPADRERIGLGPGVLRLAGRQLPLDRNGKLVLRYPPPPTDAQRIPIYKLIEASNALSEGEPSPVPLEVFRDKVVVVGSTADALLDLRKTPLSSRTPGFYISAAVYLAGATGRVWDDRWRSRAAWPLLVLFALLGAVWGARSLLRGVLGVLASLAVWSGLAGWLGLGLGVTLDLVGPVLALVLAYAVGLALSYLREQRQKRFIQGAFSQVLSRSVLEGLMRDPRRLSAGGELTELTVYFSDLAGFTGVSERLSPHALVEVLNLYLGEMVETIVEEQKGYVDKFIGDAVMAFWGAPLPDEDHAARACFAALRNQERLQSLQGALRAKGLEADLVMRIGIHTGPAVVGMMGSPKKLNYTIMGDTVNLASRLEGVNKQFGSRILISGETQARVGDRVVTREIDRIRVKGKTQPTRLYELVGLPDRMDEAARRRLWEFSQGSERYFLGDFKGGLAHFKEVLAADPQDRPAQILAERCRQYLKDPPPVDWNGVTTLTSK